MAFTLGGDPLATGLPASSLASAGVSSAPSAGNPYTNFLFNNPVTNAITGTAVTIGGGVSSTVSGVSDAVSGTTKFFSDIVNPDIWERVGLIILGMIFIAISLYLFGNAPIRAAVASIRQ